MEPAPYVWDEAQLRGLRLTAQTPVKYPSSLTPSAHNPAPGSGTTGLCAVAPNPYPFYSSSEQYRAVVQPDGGQLSGASRLGAPRLGKHKHRRVPERRSLPLKAAGVLCVGAEWAEGYAPTKEQADQDRAAAFALGVPHGAPRAPRWCACAESSLRDRQLDETACCSVSSCALTGWRKPGTEEPDVSDGPTLTLTVVSDIHTPDEYGADVSERAVLCCWLLRTCGGGHDPIPWRPDACAPVWAVQVGLETGLHSGGPFVIRVSAKTRVEELRNVIRVSGRGGVAAAALAHPRRC